MFLNADVIPVLVCHQCTVINPDLIVSQYNMTGKQAQALTESIILCGHPSVFSVLIPALMCHSLGAPVRHLAAVLCRAWVLFTEPLSDVHKNKTGMNYSYLLKCRWYSI